LPWAMRERSDLERLRDHLDKFLGIYVGLMIVIGIVTGYYAMGWVRLHAGALNDLMMASIYIMIFPMMVMLNVRGLAGAFRNWKVVSAVVLLNFAYGPLMAIALGQAFVGSPFVRLGLFVAWLVPCSSMSIGYVGLMRGDINSATSMVALSFILSLALIPVEAGLYMSTFARGIALSGAALSAVETSLVMTIIEVLLIPLVVAIPTREALVRMMGRDGFRRISPLFPSLTMIGMFIIIFTIFFAHAGVLITHIVDVLGVFYSAMVFGTVSLAVLTVLFRHLNLGRSRDPVERYRSAMVAILTGIPKNEATAIAISTVALASLGSQVAFLAAMPPSLLPAFQVVFIITYLKLRDRLIKYFGSSPEELEILETGVGGKVEVRIP